MAADHKHANKIDLGFDRTACVCPALYTFRYFLEIGLKNRNDLKTLTTGRAFEKIVNNLLWGTRIIVLNTQAVATDLPFTMWTPIKELHTFLKWPVRWKKRAEALINMERFGTGALNTTDT